MTNNESINEFKWYVENHKELYEKHKGKTLIIQNNEIIGIFDSLHKATKHAKENNILGKVFITQCNKNKSISSFGLF